MKKKLIKLCCERFKEAYREGSLHYAYETTGKKDETAWFIEDFYHIYYCPFCGAFVKGKGFGTYNETYPPVKGAKIMK